MGGPEPAFQAAVPPLLILPIKQRPDPAGGGGFLPIGQIG